MIQLKKQKNPKNNIFTIGIDEDLLNIRDTTKEKRFANINLDMPSLLAALPGQQRRAVELFILGGLKRKEAAALMGVSDNTVKTHLSAALKILREKLGITVTMFFLTIILNHLN